MNESGEDDHRRLRAHYSATLNFRAVASCARIQAGRASNSGAKLSKPCARESLRSKSSTIASRFSVCCDSEPASAREVEDATPIARRPAAAGPARRGKRVRHHHPVRRRARRRRRHVWAQLLEFFLRGRLQRRGRMIADRNAQDSELHFQIFRDREVLTTEFQECGGQFERRGARIFSCAV